MSVGADGARTVYESGAANELVSGTDANGATDDGSIDLSSTALSQIYFSATPATDTAQRGKYDGLSILEHEIGHILGIDGSRDDSGALPTDSESTWDQLVVVNGRTATFTGAHATAVYGAAVPLTTTYDIGVQRHQLQLSAVDVRRERPDQQVAGAVHGEGGIAFRADVEADRAVGFGPGVAHVEGEKGRQLVDPPLRCSQRAVRQRPSKSRHATLHVEVPPFVFTENARHCRLSCGLRTSRTSTEPTMSGVEKSR